MPTVKLTPEEIQRALQLERKCWTQQRIADELGVSRVALNRALSAIHRRAMARIEARLAAAKARQIGQLEYVAERAMDGWERSQQDAEKVAVKTTAIADADGNETGCQEVERTATTEGQAGDPRFLKEVRGALADIRKILRIEDGGSTPAAADGPHTIPPLDPRYLGADGHPADAGPEGPDSAEGSDPLLGGGDG